MNNELISSLARIRVDDLQREAANHRSLRIGRALPRPFRTRLAGAIRAMGYAALTLGDALAETR